jgi:hypothetical protein
MIFLLFGIDNALKLDWANTFTPKVDAGSAHVVMQNIPAGCYYYYLSSIL